MCSEVLRELYTERPPEAKEPDRVWAYGTRDVATAWEREWMRKLNAVGFESGESNPVLLRS